MDQQQQSSWPPTVTGRQLLLTGGIVGVLTVAVPIGYLYGITLWDWIKLLIVPAVLAGGGLWFNAQQREREHQIANERAQDEALQAYLDHMSDLLIPKEGQSSLSEDSPPESLRSLARARTLTMLTRLEGARKSNVLQFLYESGLIAKNRVVVDLRGADLSKADLSQTNLSGANLSGARLSWANLYQTNLSDANLSGAILYRADLYQVNLIEANLRMAELGEADLYVADLTRADLSDADLSAAKGVANEELAQLTTKLQGTIMPDGQKYEDWLKSKGDREEE